MQNKGIIPTKFGAISKPGPQISRLYVRQSRSGRGEKRSPSWEANPGRAIRSLVTSTDWRGIIIMFSKNIPQEQVAE